MLPTEPYYVSTSRSDTLTTPVLKPNELKCVHCLASMGKYLFDILEERGVLMSRENVMTQRPREHLDSTQYVASEALFTRKKSVQGDITRFGRWCTQAGHLQVQRKKIA